MPGYRHRGVRCCRWRFPRPSGLCRFVIQAALFQLDHAVDGMVEAGFTDGQVHARLERFVALELAACHGSTNRLLDLALRRDADDLQKLAQGGIENVFVHCFLLFGQWRAWWER